MHPAVAAVPIYMYLTYRKANNYYCALKCMYVLLPVFQNPLSGSAIA